MPNILITAKNISKQYKMSWGIVNALNNVDLTVLQGDLIAIMGPSGSGKSTLMHLLGCLDKPSNGNYFLNGIDVSSLTDHELSLIRAQQIGFVFQSFNLIPHLSVFENVEVPFSYQKNPPINYQERVLNAIKQVGLTHRVHHLPNELSGGEMQRTAIARALAINPLIILADEPTGNLDSKTGSNILDLFTELHMQGVNIIIVTHDKHVANLCPRIINMQDGSILNESCGRVRS